MLVWHCATPACMHRSIPLEDGNAGSNSLHRLVCCATHPLCWASLVSYRPLALTRPDVDLSNAEQAVNVPATEAIYYFFELKIMQSILCSLLALGLAAGVAFTLGLHCALCPTLASCSSPTLS